MSNLLDVHGYDGKIDTSQIPDLIHMAGLTIEEKKERGEDLITESLKLFDDSRRFNPTALVFLKSIVSDIGTPLNVDPTNKLVADDLICICWFHRENPDFMEQLEIQLLDMGTGFCPQGRTHRLFQLLKAFT